MSSERFIAFVLIGVGLLALVSNLAGGALWLWLGALAVLLLFYYNRQKNYGFLVVGSALSGLAIGTLIGTISGLLISLGVGFFVVDRLEPKVNRWPLYLSGALILSGLIIGLLNSGILGSLWFALLLIAAGLFLLLRNRERKTGTDGWVRVEPPKTQPVQPVKRHAPLEQAEAVVSESVSAPKAAPVTPLDKVKDDRPLQEGVETTPAKDPSVQERYKKLEQWRRETARHEDRAAYLVFSNQTLQLIAEARPQTLDALAEIKGLGPVKLERYGEQVLKLTKETQS